MGKWAKHLLFWTLLGCLAVGLLEAGLQVVIYVRGIKAETGLRSVYRYDPVCGYSLNPGYAQDTPYVVRITQDGARRTLDPIPGAREIVVMGGSTTYCLNMDDRDTWPAVLEKRLREDGHAVNVVNLGIPAQHSNNHIARFKRDVAWRKPLACIFYLNVNDAFCARQDLLGLERDLDTLAGAGGEAMPPPTSIGLVKLYRFLVSACANLYGRLNPTDRYAYLYTDEAANWTPDEECMEHFRKNVAALARLSREIGAEPVFVLPPWIFRSPERVAQAGGHDKQIFAFENSHIPYLFGRLLNWRQAQYPVLESADNALIVDLRNLFEPEVAGQIEAITRFTYDGSHLTVEGASRFGNELARQLEKSNTLKQ